MLVFKQHDLIIKALVGARKLSPFQNKGSTLENHDLPILIIKSELFINLLLLQNKASNVENSVAASWNLLPLVATGKTSLCCSPRYSDTVLSATYQQLNTHKDFTLFSTYLFNQYRYQCSLPSQYRYHQCSPVHTNNTESELHTEQSLSSSPPM